MPPGRLHQRSLFRQRKKYKEPQEETEGGEISVLREGCQKVNDQRAGRKDVQVLRLGMSFSVVDVLPQQSVSKDVLITGCVTPRMNRFRRSASKDVP